MRILTSSRMSDRVRGRSHSASVGLRVSWLVLLAVASLPGLVAGQVEIHVVEDVSGLPIAFPLVRVLDGAGIEITTVAGDAQGVAQVSSVGRTAVVEALGFQDGRVALPDTGVVSVRMEALPVELEGLVVETEGRGRSEFNMRRAAGSGLFLDPADVQLRVKYHVSDAFRDLPGVRRSLGSRGLPELISSLGSGCFAFRLDNMPLDEEVSRAGARAWDTWPLSMVTTENAMAIEVYRYFGEVPPDLRHQATVDDKLCGLILIWTTVAW